MKPSPNLCFLDRPALDEELPRTIHGGLAAARVDGAHLRSLRIGDNVPSSQARCAERCENELLIVPALAAAADGQRLGYGSGFYDATLPDFCPPARALVVIYDFQLLAELPTAENDIACSAIITDKRFITM